jgi:hypothetical protein
MTKTTKLSDADCELLRRILSETNSGKTPSYTQAFALQTKDYDYVEANR